MPLDYSERSFIGDVFFPAFEPGKILGVGAAGQVNPIDLPVLESLVFNQTTPSGSWQFTHNLGVVPFVVVYDTNDINITDSIVIFCDETIIRVEANNNLIAGRVEVYRLGVAATASNTVSLTLARTTQTLTVNSAIAANANYATSFTLAKSYILFSIHCQTPIRIRIYNSQASQQADLARASNVFPGNGNGLIFEGITAIGNEAIDLSPVATGYSVDNSDIGYITLTNLSATSISSLNFELSFLALESSSNNGGDSTTSAVDLAFSSSGDANGLFYYLGTNKRTMSWSNPAASGALVVTSSYTEGGSLISLVGRASNSWFSNNIGNSWAGFALAGGAELKPNYYSIRTRYPDIDYYPRSWIVKASKDGINWVVIDTQVNNTTLNSVNQWLSLPISTTESYSYFQLLQTGINSSGGNHFCLGTVEVYGTYYP